MPTNVDNVQIQKRVRLWVGTLAATVPTAFDSALTTGWTDLGGLTDDGFTYTGDVETEDFTDADGQVYATVIVGSSVEIKFAMVESAAAQLDYFHGAAQLPSSGGYIIDPVLTGGRKQLIRDVAMASGLIVRRYFPRTEITGREELVSKGGQPEKWGLTVAAFAHTVASGKTAPAIEWRGTPS